MIDFCKQVIEVLEMHNLTYALRWGETDRPWLTYPSTHHRLWEIDFNLAGLRGHLGETRILIKTNPNQWKKLDSQFCNGTAEYAEFCISNIEEFKEHLEELLFTTNAYNILYS